MAPKSSLLKTGTTTNEKPTYNGPRKPVTNRDKIRKAEVTDWKKKNPKNVPREAPANPKPRSLPPPSEAVLLRPRNATKVAKSTKYRKPVTTKQKIRAAAAKDKAKDPYGAAVKEQAAKAKDGAKTGAVAKTAAKVKPPGMMSVLASHGSSSKKWERPGREHNAVISRRTAKAERYLRERRDKVLKNRKVWEMWTLPQVQTLLKFAKGDLAKVLQELNNDDLLRELFEKLVSLNVLPAPKSVEPKTSLEITAFDLHGKAATFRFIDLPKELRLEIYQYAVIEPRVFIRPDSVTGIEQPDLAQTCRQVRSEVLPIFYAKNTFAVDLTYSYPIAKAAAKRASGGSKVSLYGIQALETWASALESGGWFSKIRHWVFDYAPTQSWSEEDDGSLMLSVRFTKCQDRFWSASVEVHREASCVMPAVEGHGSCNVQLTPEWVNEKVISICDAAKGEGISPDMIGELAKEVKTKAHMLAEHRCEEV